MVGRPCLGLGTDGRRSREGSITVSIHTFILQDTSLRTDRRVEELADTPTGVEEVEHVLDIQRELQLMCGFASIYLEVVLVGEVDTVHPR